MPGHVKRGGTGEPDPDPSPFLFVSWEDKQNDMAKVKRYELYKSTIHVSYLKLSITKLASRQRSKRIIKAIIYN